MDKKADTISAVITGSDAVLSADGNKTLALATIDALMKQTVKVLATAFSRVSIAELAHLVSETISSSGQHAIAPADMRTLLLRMAAAKELFVQIDDTQSIASFDAAIDSKTVQSYYDSDAMGTLENNLNANFQLSEKLQSAYLKIITSQEYQSKRIDAANNNRPPASMANDIGVRSFAKPVGMHGDRGGGFGMLYAGGRISGGSSSSAGGMFYAGGADIGGFGTGRPRIGGSSGISRKKSSDI
jgi:hypothetical protein